ncbi:hypothetical protein SAMN05216464_11249 [Mucilaginibacter pineti]|uniref:Uncharacterized protein n=1 Tax=Mucilaginibacter pineti TaxID=1391627 RepID=A0A1G7HVW0_9SPHI|nr:hypothetical protein [Mucilaginibacter pineti]SDF04582.1 hypothetical protein SAMN05216464_11249 [Mucilaginibacter pineti]
MKIRIKGNYLRYRLTRTDMARLAEEGYIKEVVEFGSQQLFYALQVVDDEHLSATYHQNTIVLYVPKSVIIEFVNTDKVGYEGTHGNFHLLVEKDFTCLDNVAEDQSDNYPNPLAAK